MLFFDELQMSPFITSVLAEPTAVQLLAVLLLWSLAFGPFLCVYLNLKISLTLLCSVINIYDKSYIFIHLL